MNLNISNKLINEIADKLFAHGYDKLYNELHNTILESQPKEITYATFGNEPIDFNRFYAQFKKIKNDRNKVEKTKQNHLFLKRDENGHFLPKYRKLKKFGYHSWKSNTISVRTVEVKSQDDEYISGIDLKDNKLKNFRKDRIVGVITTIRQKI